MKMTAAKAIARIISSFAVLESFVFELLEVLKRGLYSRGEDFLAGGEAFVGCGGGRDDFGDGAVLAGGAMCLMSFPRSQNWIKKCSIQKFKQHSPVMSIYDNRKPFH